MATKGISYIKGIQRYHVRPCVNGRTIFLGNFETREEAEEKLKSFRSIYKSGGYVDYDKAARNPKVWKQLAHDQIKRLTNKYGVVHV